MPKLISTERNLPWITGESEHNSYVSETLPPDEQCTAAFAVVVKDRQLLFTDLREGERQARMLDIPGGHRDRLESPEDAAIRETYEETGVRVKVIKPVGYKQTTIFSKKPDGYPYPYPTAHMAFYLCEVVSESDFNGNDETHGRMWLPLNELDKSKWYVKNKAFLDAILNFL